MFVLLAGLLLFGLATVSFRDPERHAVLFVAAAGAFAIWAVSIIGLAYFVQRPMVELQRKDRSGERRQSERYGDLGRDFNHMMQQLRDTRAEIELLHRTQMSRAEHLATLGELAAGLAHEIGNPLAGIAGVMEIMGRDLPATSPARAVLKDVRLEVAQINRILTDLLETARPHPLFGWVKAMRPGSYFREGVRNWRTATSTPHLGGIYNHVKKWQRLLMFFYNAKGKRKTKAGTIPLV